MGVKTGSSVTRRCMGDRWLAVAAIGGDFCSCCWAASRAAASGSARISLCLSSPASSASEFSPSSKVSANV